MKRIGKWILIAFAFLVGALAVLFIAKPDTLLVAAIILAMLFNPGPPPIAEGQLAGIDWMHPEEGGQADGSSGAAVSQWNARIRFEISASQTGIPSDPAAAPRLLATRSTCTHWRGLHQLSECR